MSNIKTIKVYIKINPKVIMETFKALDILLRKQIS